jgi:hypothetical protein
MGVYLQEVLSNALHEWMGAKAIRPFYDIQEMNHYEIMRSK